MLSRIPPYDKIVSVPTTVGFRYQPPPLEGLLVEVWSCFGYFLFSSTSSAAVANGDVQTSVM